MTYGWIAEGDDRRREPLDPVPDPTGRIKPVFDCPFCVKVFEQSDQLNAHVQSVHKVERPVLRVRGKEPSRRDIVRSKVCISDVDIMNATRARLALNSEASVEISIEELKAHLTRAAQSEFKIDLINESQPRSTPIIQSYSLSFRVADDEALGRGETAVVDRLVHGAISRAAIDQFINDPRASGVGKEYADGLAAYCLGILQKERSQSEALTTPFSDYRKNYGEALEVLKDIPRRSAYLVESIIRFALNDFSRERQRTGFADLDLVNELLLNPMATAVPQPVDLARRRVACPIDHATYRVLEVGARALRASRWSPVLEAELNDLATASDLGLADRQKGFAIWAAAALRTGSPPAAIEPLRHIAALHPFSEWASEHLEQATP